MSKLLVVKNISREGLGLLEPLLVQRGITYDLVDLSVGNSFPDPTTYKAVIVLGGPDSANDATSKMGQELQQVQQILAQGIPFLGICLGLQVLVKAAGGQVVKAGVKEIGFNDPSGLSYVIKLTDAGKADPLLRGLPEELTVFQLHGETVQLTDDMQLLGTGAYCQNQIVKVAEKAYGIQSHFELTPAMLKVWAAEDPDLIPLGLDKLRQQFAEIEKAYTQIGTTLLTNFLELALTND